MIGHPTDVRAWGHPILAAWCAGPAFLAGFIASLAGSSPEQMLATAAGSVFVLPLAIPIGFFVAVVPNLLCTFILRMLAERHAWLRPRAVWGTIGALLAGGTLLTVSESIGVAALFAVPGAASALICRSGIAWTDGPCPTPAALG